MESVLGKIKAFAMNGSDGVYDGTCLYDVYSVFSKASGLHYKWEWWNLWLSLSLSQCFGSLLLAKFQVFIINGNDVVCDGARFYLHAVVICF